MVRSKQSVSKTETQDFRINSVLCKIVSGFDSLDFLFFHDFLKQIICVHLGKSQAPSERTLITFITTNANKL